MDKERNTREPAYAYVPWLVSEAFLSLGAGLVLSSLPLLLLGKDADPLGLELLAYTLQIVGFSLVPLVLVHKKYHLLPSALGLVKPSGKLLAIAGGLAGIGLYLMNMLLTTVMVMILPERLIQEQSVVTLMDMAGGPWELALVAVFVVLLAPFAEELLFRGFLYPALAGRIGRTWSVLLGAAIFAGLHMNLAAFLPLFAGGIGFNLLYDKHHNLFCNVAAHALWNGLALVLYLIAK